MKSILKEKQSKKTFEEKIDKLSKTTQKNIISAINSFDKFCIEYYEVKGYEQIFTEINKVKKEQRDDTVRDILQNWIDDQYKKNLLTTGVKNRISKIKRIFSHNGIKYHEEDFSEPLEYKPTIKEELYEITMDDVQRIFAVASPKKLSYYTALVSTGARPSELLQVRKKDIDVTGDRIKIRIEAENVKTRSGRSVWLTKEACRYLIPRLRDKQDNDLVWGTNENPQYSEINESSIFTKYAESAGFTEKYKSNGYRKITLYSFRSFFFGIASDVHREGYAHKIIGHGGYLPQYDRMNEEKKLEWFLKVEPKLTVDQSSRDKITISKLTKENTEKRDLEMKVSILSDENKNLMEELHKVVDDVKKMKSTVRFDVKRIIDDYEWEKDDLSNVDDLFNLTKKK